MPTLPSKRRRLTLRLAGFAIGIAVIAGAYQLTRPPELVWWTSPRIGRTDVRAKLLIPYGWSATSPSRYDNDNATTWLRPNKAPHWLRWLTKKDEESDAVLLVEFGPKVPPKPEGGFADTARPPKKTLIIVGGFVGIGSRSSKDERTNVSVLYARQSERAFNRTYKQICNSLTIE